ncbi:MAG: hypothetical protein IT457_22140 [Planctomycetes bacterium]|nr:hypothetical protein [Planctomycetota bacterium]
MPGLRSALAFLFLLSFSALGSAQSGWSLQGFMPPGAEEGTAAVWCPTRQSILVVTRDKVFEGQAGTWSLLLNGLGYPYCHSSYVPVAYWDSSNDALVLVSDGSSSTLMIAIRTWNPTRGFGGSGLSVPESFTLSAAFYDEPAARGIVLLSDGRILEIPSVGAPSIVTPPTRPFIPSLSGGYPALRSSALDVHRRRIVALIGTPVGQLWEYDLAAGAWFQGPPMPPSFALRAQSTVGYDALRRVVVIFGGWPAEGGAVQWHLPPLNDVWHYDGSQVFQAAPGSSPIGRRAGSFVWEPTRHALQLLGGANSPDSSNNGCPNLRDVWSYVPGQAGVDYTFFGNACPGSAGTPYLEVLPNTLPFAGRPFSLMVKNAPFFAPVFMLVGASDQVWYGNPLPLALGPLGAAGCSLLTGPDVVYPTTNLFGTALWTATLPSGLAGATIFNQGVILDASANALGLSLTNGGRAIVGR